MRLYAPSPLWRLVRVLHFGQGLVQDVQCFLVEDEPDVVHFGGLEAVKLMVLVFELDHGIFEGVELVPLRKKASIDDKQVLCHRPLLLYLARVSRVSLTSQTKMAE